jgi:hypothetical protein
MAVSDCGWRVQLLRAFIGTHTPSSIGMKPRGIALITCCQITSEDSAGDAASRGLSCPRTLIKTFDTYTADHFPCAIGPFAVYVLVSGSGKHRLALMLEAPNGEFLFAYNREADSWGTLGMWEWVAHIDAFNVTHAGIYCWKISSDADVLIQRPMCITPKT